MPLDDDKKHASFSNTDNIRSHEGLKLVTNPNFRKGMVGHAAVSSCVRLARGTAWEKLGLVPTDCCKNTTQVLFRTKSNLDRVLFWSDRGCWNLNLLKHTVSRGGDMIETVERSHWFHCARNQKLRNNDKRVLLDERSADFVFCYCDR